MQSPLRFVVPQDHSSLPGHFPGNPIVPGVVVLDYAMAALRRERPADRLAGFDDVKFIAPVAPGAEVTVTCGESAPGRLSIVCAVDGRTVLRGRARLGNAG